METTVNIWGVIAAAASSMVVGSIWYAKPIFGRRWAAMVGLSDEQMASRAVRGLFVALLCSVITAYVLAHIAFIANQHFGNSFLQDSVTTALWLWLGLTAARILVHDTFEQRRKKLSAYTIGNEFVTIVVMGLIIGLVGV